MNTTLFLKKFRRFVLVGIGMLGVTSLPYTLKAQQDSVHKVWDHNLIASLNLAQVSFTHWQAGGTDALSYIANINGKSVEDLPTINWSNTYKLTFGQARLGSLGLRKTDDEINLESMLTYKLGTHINPYGDLSLISQFAPGYNYTDTSRTQVSSAFDPAYFKQSAGIGFKPSTIFQTRLGVAVREIFANQFTSFTDDPNTPEIEKTRVEGGFESVSELEWPVDDNVLLRAKLELFDPVKHMDRVVVHSQGTIVGKISKYFSTELSALIIEEPEISPYTQIKEGLSIAITYTVF